MQNAFFMKEALVNIEKNVSFVELNQKQLKPAIEFTINSLLEKEKKMVILVSLTQSGEDILKSLNKSYSQRLLIIDGFSKKEESYIKNIIQISSAADLTGIQIAIEQAEEKLNYEKVIIIDSLNVMAIYNKENTLGKFLHMFSNKIRLNDDSSIILTIKESTDKEIIDLAKEFSDKTYDYSDLYASAIALAESNA